ncbi:unnamed protein product [Ixodes pacificus]
MHAVAGVTEVEAEARLVESSLSMSEADGQGDAVPQLPELESDEVRYFELVQAGRISELQEFLDAHKELNKDAVNCQGYTALHAAIHKKDLPMARFLVSKGVRLMDALLHAVQTGDIAMTEFLLGERSKTEEGCGKRGYASSPSFTVDISPVILAAQMNDWELIRFFLKRGITVDPPHMASCMCSKCIKSTHASDVNTSTRNLNAFKAISSPHYLLQVSADPFLDAFMYAKHMENASSVEEEFKMAYEEEINKLRAFVRALLDQCRTGEEVQTLMERKAGLDGDIGHLTFPRIILALELYQKEFVTHSYVQQVLRLEWEGEFQAWSRLPLVSKVGHGVARFLTLPLIALWVKLRPNTKVTKHWTSPVSKYLHAFAGRILFVVFVYLEITLDRARMSRGPPNTGLEWLIVIWVIGYIGEEIVHCCAKGPSRYFKSLWTWYDITMLSFFILTFVFWLVAWVEISQDPSGGDMPKRNEWPSTDSTLVHEGLFAVSSVLSVFKLVWFLQESAKLGPLQVSISSMIIEIVRFLFFCVGIMLAFAFGLTRMYEPYAGMKRKEENGDEVTQSRAFISFSQSMKTLFIRMLGVASEEQSDVVVSNRNDGSINTHDLTQFLGSLMYCTYQVIMLVAMLNSLIAIVTATFQKILDNAELYWKYYRTKLWMHYINEAMTVPSPFYFIQIPFFVIEAAARKRLWPARREPTLPHSEVIQNLVQRYLCQNKAVLNT